MDSTPQLAAGSGGATQPTAVTPAASSDPIGSLSAGTKCVALYDPDHMWCQDLKTGTEGSSYVQVDYLSKHGLKPWYLRD